MENIIEIERDIERATETKRQTEREGKCERMRHIYRRIEIDAI